jgi:predicted esterase
MVTFNLLALVSLTGRAFAEPGYQAEVSVSNPTRLDWTFVLANQSVVEPPADWLGTYESKSQRYECFIPATTKKAKSDGLPVVIFVSASDAPAGWSQLESVCKQKGVVFASPYGAGNNTAMPRRVRIVLDVLDDLRRDNRIDPDRTYIGGFSGGGRVACAIAFALPELFGGVIPVCAGGELRDEPWLRHRAIDRLSIAFLTGSDDFNLGEIDRFKAPLFTDLGIRTKVTVVPSHGHAVPGPKVFQAALDWLDSGATDRRKQAAQRPGLHLRSDQSTTREELAKSMLSEGEKLVTDRKTMFKGLMLLQGTMTRWPDLPEADKAKRILLDHEERKEKPWEADDIADQRKYIIAYARALDGYAAGELPQQYEKQRPDMLKAAIAAWNSVVQDGEDDKAVREAKRRLPVLEKLLDQ